MQIVWTLRGLVMTLFMLRRVRNCWRYYYYYYESIQFHSNCNLPISSWETQFADDDSDLNGATQYSVVEYVDEYATL